MFLLRRSGNWVVGEDGELYWMFEDEIDDNDSGTFF